MTAVATAIVGSAVIGAGVGIYGAKKSADAQRDAADAAAQVQWDMYSRNRSDMMPWMREGEHALNVIGNGLDPGGEFRKDFTAADFRADPGYQFRKDEGLRAVEASAAARGGALSGGALKNIMDYGQGFASNEYANAYNRWNADRDRRFGRLSQVAGIGQTATGQVAQQGMGTAGSVGDFMTQGANARASGYVGAANSINQGIGTIGNFFASQYQQPQSGQQWWAAGQPAAGAASGSWGTPGLNNFFYGNGTSGD